MALPNGKMSAWGLARKRKSSAQNPLFGKKTRKKAGRTLAKMPRFPAYFADQPLQKRVRLRYVSHERLAGPAAAAIVVKEFRANGLYDPQVALGGHQPYGFDQLMNMYTHFTVLRSVMEIENLNATRAENVVLIGALTQESGSVTAAWNAGGPNGLRELPALSSDTIMNVYGGYQQRARNSFLTFDATKVFGKSAANLIGDARFQGDVGSDPTEDAYFTVALYSPNSLDESGNMWTFKVTITYYAVFTEPKWFTTS